MKNYSSHKVLNSLHETIKRTSFPVVTITIFSLINALFAWKYGSRLGGGSFCLLALITAASLCPALIFMIYRSEHARVLQRVLASNLLTASVIIGVVAGAFLFFRFYPQTRIRVDRYEMIDLFWDNALSMKCPYCPRRDDTNIPGPFPFYFYASLPFYLMGEIGWYSLGGFLLFSVFVMKTAGLSQKLKNSVLLLCATSPAVLFEICCRSTNFLNGTLLLYCTMLIYATRNAGGVRKVLTTGVFTGLVLSTRSFAFLNVAMSILFTFKERLFSRRALSVLMTATVVFLITFLPVITVCGRDFMTYNPFLVQSLFAPFLSIALISAVAAVLSYRSRSVFTLYTIDGYVFTLMVAAYCARLISAHGVNEAVFGNMIDVSYFSLGIPFLLMGMASCEKRE